MNRAYLLAALTSSLALGPIGLCKHVARGCLRGGESAVLGADAVAPPGKVTTASASAGAGGGAAAPLPPIPPLAAIGPERPRVLLRGPLLDAIRARKAPRAAARCEAAAAKPLESGYEAWDWTNATLSCALAWRATGDERYAKTGVQYFGALLDDDKKVGDHAGGDEIVRHDSGYSIRTRGFLTAIAYDWLHDAPGTTPATRAHARDRFAAWISWFSEKGYQRDKPIANYYAGYFGAIGMAGLATSGDDGDARGAELRTRAQRMFFHEVVPALARLDGGGWPEGWQYGGGSEVAFALYATAEHVQKSVPWIAQSVAFHAAATWPDGKHVFDDGDWSKKPALAEGPEMDAAAVALAGDGGSAQAAAIARALGSSADGARRPQDDAWTWLEELAAAAVPAPKETPPPPASFFARGTGTVFARTDASRTATWLAFQAAPFLADHQHLDAGHFELVRGGDALLADPGGYGAGSSLAHNVLLVDDGGAALAYFPNQTPERSRAHVTRFQGDGDVVYALADLTTAYEPFKEEDTRRPVTRALRELVFLRDPAGAPRLVVRDRVGLADGGTGVTWAAHFTGDVVAPSGGVVRVTSGASAAAVTTVAPAGAAEELVAEPKTPKKDVFWYGDTPAEGLRGTRLEVASPRGAKERGFLHAIVAGARDAALPPATAVQRAKGVDGVVVGDAAVAFATTEDCGGGSGAASLSYAVPASVRRHVVAGLAPRSTWKVAVAGDAVTLTKGGDRAASDAGVLTF